MGLDRSTKLPKQEKSTIPKDHRSIAGDLPENMTKTNKVSETYLRRDVVDEASNHGKQGSDSVSDDDDVVVVAALLPAYIVNITRQRN